MSKPDPRLAHMPPAMRAVAALGGVDVAERIMMAFGGTRIYVPRRPHAKSAIWEKCGREAARALSAVYPGEYLEVPGTKFYKAGQLRAAIVNSTGTHDQVAATFGVHRQTVKKMRRKLRRETDPRQGALL